MPCLAGQTSLAVKLACGARMSEGPSSERGEMENPSDKWRFLLKVFLAVASGYDASARCVWRGQEEFELKHSQSIEPRCHA